MSELNLALILLGKPLLAVIIGYAAYRMYDGAYKSRLFLFALVWVFVWCANTIILRILLFDDKNSYWFIGVWDSIIIRAIVLFGILIFVAGLFTKSIHKTIYGLSILGILSIWLVTFDIIIAAVGYADYLDAVNVPALLFLQTLAPVAVSYHVYQVYNREQKYRLFISICFGAAIWTIISLAIMHAFSHNERYFDEFGAWSFIFVLLYCIAVILILLFGLIKRSKNLMKTGGIMILALISGFIPAFFVTTLLLGLIGSLSLSIFQ